MGPRDRIQLIAMSVLAALFVARVAAQLVQAIFPLSWLPPFEVWHSGVLPYTLLLACQLCIIGLMSYCLHAVRSGWKRSRRWKYRGCFAFGGVYFAFMAFRWIAGVTFLAEHSWFSSTLAGLFSPGSRKLHSFSGLAYLRAPPLSKDLPRLRSSLSFWRLRSPGLILYDWSFTMSASRQGLMRP